jgi:homoserine kinase type II
MISLDFDTLAGLLARWNLRPARLRPDVEIAGSPERSLSRSALEDADGAIYILESLDPSGVDRKREIARTIAALHPRLPEARPYLTLPDGDFFARAEGRFWQAAPYVEGVPLPRPDYAGENRRARPLADLLVRLRAASRKLPKMTESSAFSSTLFIRDLEHKIRSREAALHARILPAFTHLETSFFPVEAGLPSAFAHGDFHPLNMIWSADGIRALVDWEFCGTKPEAYDAALLVGCLGMEHPQFLLGDLVMELVARLRRDAGYAERSWEAFFDLVMALRFAWLSDWLRRGDAEMIDLEAAYIGLLHENRGVFRRSWGLSPSAEPSSGPFRKKG